MPSYVKSKPFSRKESLNVMRAILEPGALEVKEVGEQPVKSLFLASMKDTREDRAQRKKSDTN